jgi:cytochrome P450
MDSTACRAQVSYSSSVDSTLYPSSFEILFRSFWRYIPVSILHYVKYWPTREYTRFRRYLQCVQSYAKDIIQKNEEQGDGKDLMSILMRANKSEDPKARMTDREVLNQISSGHPQFLDIHTKLLTYILR